MSDLAQLHYHRNAARREEQAASRAADCMCARIHDDLATMHRLVAAQLEVLDQENVATLQQVLIHRPKLQS